MRNMTNRGDLSGRAWAMIERGFPAIESFVQDVRLSMRLLRRHAGFATLTVTILALGIGGSAAIFSLVHTVLLRPLPFPEPDQLVVLWEDLSATGSAAGLSRVEPSPANYAAWRERSRSFAQMAALDRRIYSLTGAGEPEKLVGLRATGNLFELLRMRAVLGRPLIPDDERPEADPVVVIAERFWRQRFGSDPTLVGRVLRLNGLPHTVVGVVPDDFRFPDRETALWVPASFTSQELASHAAHWYVVARLRDGIALRQAHTEMTTIASAMASERRDANAGIGVTVTTLHEQLSYQARPALVMLLGAVGVVLLIACANVAGLLLARGAGRQKEFALRQALGAGQGRIVRQLVTETLVLVTLGGIAGVVLCAMSSVFLARLIPEMLPGEMAFRIDAALLVFTAGISLLTLILFSTGPSFAVARVDLNAALAKGGGRGTTTRTGRLRGALVIAEIALTVILLTGAGLLFRSYTKVLAVDPGFDAQRLLVAETILPPSKYVERTRRTAFYRDVLARVEQIPGVTAAGYVNYPPLTLKEGRGYLTIEGQPPPPVEMRARQVVSWRMVSPQYLPALGVPLLRGRHLEDRDGPDAPPAVLINQAMARLHWPDRNPIGQRLKLGRQGSPNPWCTIVGVVGDVRQMGLEAPAEPEVYFSLDQNAGATPFFWPQHLVVRSERDPIALAPAIRRAVGEVDPEQPVSNIRPMTEIVGGELSQRQTQMSLVAAFALFATLLAAVGLYAVLSYEVARRTPEIGLRMALGARRAQVLAVVVGGAARPAMAGLGLGWLGALGLTRLLTAMLFGVQPLDPLTFVVVPLLLMVVALVATYVPARRAMRIDPLCALRAE